MMTQLPGWILCKKITIQDTYVDSDLVDFPLYVKIANDPDFHRARADGHDIRFTLSDGITLLKYEREYWSGGNGSPATAHFWVKVPSILASGGAIIYIYYGKSDAPDGQDAPNVWDANFKGVWHLKENGGLALDSTGNGNNGTLYPTPVLISACDEVTDWSGDGVLSIDNEDKMEGLGSLKDYVAEPIVDIYYDTTYNPTGTWNWSAKKHILVLLKSDRPSTAFSMSDLLIYDTLNNWRRWNLSFSAGVWTLFKLPLLSGDGDSATPPDFTLIDKVAIFFRAADTTGFYKKVDFLRIDDPPQWVEGKVNKALDFDDQENDYVAVPDDDSLDFIDKITVEALFYYKGPTERRHQQMVVGRAYKWRFGLQSSLSNVFGFYAPPPYTGSWMTTYISRNTWCSGAFTYDKLLDSNNSNLFLDGDVKKQKDAEGDLDSASHIYIGVHNPGTYHFYGLIDEVRLSNIARVPAYHKFKHHNIFAADNELTWGDEEGVYYGPGFPRFEKKKELLLIDEKKPVLIGHRR